MYIYVTYAQAYVRVLIIVYVFPFAFALISILSLYFAYIIRSLDLQGRRLKPLLMQQIASLYIGGRGKSLARFAPIPALWYIICNALCVCVCVSMCMCVVVLSTCVCMYACKYVCIGV